MDFAEILIIKYDQQHPESIKNTKPLQGRFNM